VNPTIARLLPALRLVTAAALTIACGTGAAITPPAGAPDFTLPSLGGPNLRLQEQRGRVVMVNFWASWCGPCRVEMPHLARLYDKYRSSGFVVLGVNIDEDPRKAASLAGQLGMRFPVLLDTEKKVSRMYDLSTMPSTILIDRDGRVRYVHRGYRDGYEDTYDRQIRELLRE
jgi:thiol-disulfide isomerase/thioredoxin